MGVVEVVFEKTEEDGVYQGVKTVNCLVKAAKDNSNIDFKIIRAIQNNAHSHILNIFKDEKGITIVDSTIHNVIYCGQMTDKEFKDEQVH